MAPRRPDRQAQPTGSTQEVTGPTSALTSFLRELLTILRVVEVSYPLPILLLHRCTLLSLFPDRPSIYLRVEICGFFLTFHLTCFVLLLQEQGITGNINQRPVTPSTTTPPTTGTPLASVSAGSPPGSSSTPADDSDSSAPVPAPVASGSGAKRKSTAAEVKAAALKKKKENEKSDTFKIPKGVNVGRALIPGSFGTCAECGKKFTISKVCWFLFPLGTHLKFGLTFCWPTTSILFAILEEQESFAHHARMRISKSRLQVVSRKKLQHQKRRP